MQSSSFLCSSCHKNQNGFMSIVVLMLLVIISFVSLMMAHVFITSSMTTTDNLGSMQAYYLAQSGIERATEFLLLPDPKPNAPTRITCPNVTGNASLTNGTFAGAAGTFTVTGTDAFAGGSATSPTYLTANITAAATTISVFSTAGYTTSGRIMIDHEIIDYTGVTATSFTGCMRARGGSVAASHVGNALAAGVHAYVAQNQCGLSSTGYVPSSASPYGQRSLTSSAQLQELFVAGNPNTNGGNHNNTLIQWNRPTQLAWTDYSVNAGSAGAAQTLWGVSMLNNSAGWAVGLADTTPTPNVFTIYQWNPNFVGPPQGQWIISPGIPAPGATKVEDLTASVVAVSTTEAWTAGNPSTDATPLFTILYWNGSSWCLLTTAVAGCGGHYIDNASTAGHAAQIDAIHVIDTANPGTGAGTIGFAGVDNGGILQYNGSKWSFSAVSADGIYAIYVVSGSEAWAGDTSGEIWKWNGAAWAKNKNIGKEINWMVMIDTSGTGHATSGWAVGTGGAAAYYNGTTWSANLGTGQANDLWGVIMLSDTDVWAVGVNNTLLHMTNPTVAVPVWNSVSVPATISTSTSLNSIDAVGAHIKSLSQGPWNENF